MLLLISLTLALAAPSLSGFAASRQTADAATRVISLTKFARSQAVAKGQICRLNVATDGITCWLTVQRAGQFVPADGDWGQPFKLPEGAKVTLRPTTSGPTTHGLAALGLPAHDPAAQQPVPYVQFYPDGRSDVATLEVKSAQGRLYLVTCDSPAEPFRVVTPVDGADR